MLNIPTKGILPVRAHPTDAGADLVSINETLLPYCKKVLVHTGTSVKIPKGYVGILVPRSSLSKLDVIMTNSVGIIDSDYRGEIMASLMYIGNTQSATFIEAGTRIVQLLIMPVVLAEFGAFDASSMWDDTERGMNGFGSTGTK